MKRWLKEVPAAILILFLTLAVTIVVTQPSGTRGRVAPGEVAKQTYKAPRTVTYKSDLKTSEAENKITSQVPTVYRKDLTATSQQDGKLQATVAAVNAVRADSAPIPDRLSRLQQIIPNLSSAEAEGLLRLDDPTWQRVVSVTHDTLARLQGVQVTQDDLSKAEELVAGQLPGDLPVPVRSSVLLLGKRLLIPNYLIDEEASNAAKNKAKGAVEPVSYTVERDQVIAYRGQVLSAFDVERLTALGLTRPAFNWQKTLGVFLLVVTFMTLLIRIAPGLTAHQPYPRRLIGVLTIFAIALVLAGVWIIPPQPILAYVLPVAAPAVLLTVFYGLPTALVAGTAYAALYALAAGGSFELFFIHLAATGLSVVYARRLVDIKGFLRTGAVSALVVFVGTVAFSLLAANFDISNIPKFLLAAGLNGALLATFVFAGAAFLGGPLGVVTFLQLLELESPRQPLLRRLASEAPGTYSHSLRMSVMVESVAKLIGADPLLARVQTLYHDIGKVAFPEYFIENQRGTENPHGQLSPKESAELLRAHISEGLSLAKGAGVPEPVMAAIPEHHGTTRMEYFWEDAKRGSKRPQEADFRYLGPKPHSKETASIMLADAVEAASRTINAPDQAKIERVVESVFSARLADGQLDHAPLSARELTIMKQAFTETIMGELHKRIRYPAKQSAKKS